MKNNLRTLRLSECARVVRGVSYKPSDLESVKDPVELLRATNVGMNQIILKDTVKVPSFLVKKDQFLQKYDIVVTMSSGSRLAVGRLAQLRVEWPGTFGAFCGAIRPNPEAINPAFLGYILNTRQFREHIDANAEGTAIMNLTGEKLLSYEFKSPSLDQQSRIVGILGALDEKIELNRKMNETLDQMARAIFQSWFVNFDPVYAKAAGKKVSDMDKETSALFPDCLIDSEKGKIPKGWRVLPVGEAVECVGGATPSTAESKYWEGGTHYWTTPKDFSSLASPFLLQTDRKLTDEGISKISSGILPAGTLLLSSRAPIGYLAIAAVPVAINQGFIALKCNEDASNFFMLNWCRANMAEIESRATGTTFPEISKLNFRPIRVCLPPKELMSAFTAKVAPLYAEIILNLRQSDNLSSIRDALLPKLLNGEVETNP
jgi:type I restriction enzyme S subunit